MPVPALRRMDGCCGLAMLATLGGFLALLLGLLLLLLPLLVHELSRAGDSSWGAVVLLLGLVLVTSAERLTGAPMLAVLCGGLLVGRLGTEVAQGRWRSLSDEERLALLSAERWKRSLDQLGASAASLLQSAAAMAGVLAAWLAERRQGRSHGKRWVRRETGSGPTASPAEPQPAGNATSPEPSSAETSAAEATAATAANTATASDAATGRGGESDDSSGTIASAAPLAADPPLSKPGDATDGSTPAPPAAAGGEAIPGSGLAATARLRESGTAAVAEQPSPQTASALPAASDASSGSESPTATAPASLQEAPVAAPGPADADPQTPQSATEATAGGSCAAGDAAATLPQAAAEGDPGVRVVESFSEIVELLEAAPAPAGSATESDGSAADAAETAAPDPSPYLAPEG